MHRLAILDKLWRNRDPWAGFEYRRHRIDEQGWNSHHPFLATTVEEIRPTTVIEVGVWKGGSSIEIARSLKRLELDAVIIAVDTWLGSWEHWERHWFDDLLFQNGFPGLYYTFLANVMHNELQDYIIPLPLDSCNAAIVLGHKELRADMIHIDAGHDYNAVSNDLKAWWALLNPGGIMIVDDYDLSGVVWPSVRNAVDDFLAATAHRSFEAVSYKCRFRKPECLQRRAQPR